jgi:hypothetical protein
MAAAQTCPEFQSRFLNPLLLVVTGKQCQLSQSEEANNSQATTIRTYGLKHFSLLTRRESPGDEVTQN